MKDFKVIVFDLIGTLLDLSALDPQFREEFGSRAVRREWFSQALEIAFATSAAADWTQFSDIAEAALKVVEERHQRRLSWFKRRRILSSLRRLPAFPDVIPGLTRLAGGHEQPLAILTNSSVRAAQEALAKAGVENQFEKILSADKVKRLKPAIEPYRMAAKELGVKPAKVLFVAAHAWDLRGASRAGFATCFLRRPEQVLDELAPKPDLIVNDLEQLAAVLNS